MRRTLSLLGPIIAIVGLALAACAPTGSPGSSRPADATCVIVTPEPVRDDHRFTDQDVPGIGDYLELHWFARALGDPCSRAPGPTDVQYFGLAQLRPASVSALSTTYHWSPSLPPQLPPALASSLPADLEWQHSGDYPTTAAGRTVTLSFEPAHALVYFVLTTS